MSDGRWVRWVTFGGLVLAVVMIAADVLLDHSARDVSTATVPEGDGADVRPASPSLDEVVSAEAPLITAAAPQRLGTEGGEGVVLDLATFRGTVAVEQAGGPLAGATVWHVPDATTLTAMGFDVDSFARLEGGVEEILPLEHMTSTVTREDGTFEFRAPSMETSGERRWPDVPMLVATHPEMATRPLRCSGFRGGLDATFDAGTIELDRGATITGWVGTKSETGVARPLGDARVSVWSASWAGVWSSAVDISRWGWLDFRRDFFHFFETHTQPDGSFELHGVVSGLVAMEVEADDYATWRAPGVYLERGAEHRYADVFLEMGSVLDVLVVADESKVPIPGARITIVDPADFNGWDVVDGSRVVARKTTDASGRAMFTGLSSQLLASVVEVEGFGRHVIGAVVADDRSAPKTRTWSLANNVRAVDIYASISPIRFSDFDIDAWGVWTNVDGVIEEVEKLAVVERDPEDGEPLGVLLDERGADVIIVRSSRSGYVPTFEAIDRGDEAVVLSASLKRSIRGIVVDANGLGVAGAVVRVLPKRHWEGQLSGVDEFDRTGSRLRRPWDAVATVRTASDGTFTVDAPGLGPCTLHASSAQGAAKDVVFDPTRKDEIVRLTLAPVGAIEGSLIDALGRPVAGALVAIEGPEARETHTNDEGRFAFAGLLLGYYRVKGHLAADADCSVSAGATRTLELIALAQPVLRGQVRKEMQAVPYARVTAWWDDGAEFSLVADVLGFFEVVLPRKGTLQIVAQSREGSLSEVERLRVRWGELHDVSLEFGSRTLRGSCVGGDVDDTRVAYVRYEQVALVIRQVIDENGLFVFEDLPRGPVEVGVESNGVVLARRALDTASGRLKPFDLRDKP